MSVPMMNIEIIKRGRQSDTVVNALPCSAHKCKLIAALSTFGNQRPHQLGMHRRPREQLSRQTAIELRLTSVSAFVSKACSYCAVGGGRNCPESMFTILISRPQGFGSI